jgi:hypothetical protein
LIWIFDCLLNINIDIKPQYPHLPANLQQQLAALPPLLRPLRSHPPAPAPQPAPASASVSVIFSEILN